MAKKIVTARLDEVLYEKLRALANTEERSIAYVIEKAIAEYVIRNSVRQLKLNLEERQ